MILAYFDEAGDDGYPQTSSALFALTTIYLHYQNWKATFDSMREIRRYLKATYKLPMKMELHTRDLLLNKKPYGALNIPDDQRFGLVGDCCRSLATLDIRVINVVINKSTIISSDYPILDNAFTYAIQRIENDLNSLDPSSKFMIIVDPGRVGKMRKTARRIQRVNFIPSRFSAKPYRREIRRLIEDPLQKESSESYFIQFCDMISFIVYQFKQLELGVGTPPNRVRSLLTRDKLIEWLDDLKPILNLRASTSDPYGIVCYPK